MIKPIIRPFLVHWIWYIEWFVFAIHSFVGFFLFLDYKIDYCKLHSTFMIMLHKLLREVLVSKLSKNTKISRYNYFNPDSMEFCQQYANRVWF